MSKKVVAVALTIAILGSLIPSTVNAFDWVNIIQKIKDIINWIKLIKDYSELGQGATFVFGGRITHSEGGCMLFAKYCPLGICILPSVIRIPLGGDTIEVGPPLDSPEGQMFTLPMITGRYANNNEDTEGVWTLGIGFNQFPIDLINDVLGQIPPITVPYGTIDGWNMDCSDNSKNLILKIGTSG